MPVVMLASPDRLTFEEALVVTDVEIGLRAVLGDEHLAVLERVHRAGIDIEVWVELLHETLSLRATRRLPRLEAVRPLPSEEATPPVTKRCLVSVRGIPRASSLRRGALSTVNPPESFQKPL